MSEQASCPGCGEKGKTAIWVGSIVVCKKCRRIFQVVKA